MVADAPNISYKSLQTVKMYITQKKRLPFCQRQHYDELHHLCHALRTVESRMLFHKMKHTEKVENVIIKS